MPNVTVGYYVTHGEMVYTASVVVEALSIYGIERLMADIRQFVPLVQAIPIPAVPWRPSPAISLMLKTGQSHSSISVTTLMCQRCHTYFFPYQFNNTAIFIVRPNTICPTHVGCNLN